MSYNNIDGTLLTRKAQVSIKAGATFYTLGSLKEIIIGIGMDYEYAKATNGQIKALPISQNSDFAFTVKRTDDFYDATGVDKKTISYFEQRASAIPPEVLDIEFKFLSISGLTSNEQVEVTHIGVVERIEESWSSDLGGEELAVTGRIITPGVGVRS
jgi:hypothetical protein